MSEQTSQGSLAQYAIFLQGNLNETFGITLSNRFSKFFRRDAARVGPQNYEDFGSLVFLECLERKANGRTIDEREIHRSIDTVRHRLVRSMKKATHQPALDFAVSGQSPVSYASDVERLDRLREALLRLSPAHSMLFELRYFRDLTDSQIAKALGISRSTVHRRLQQVREVCLRVLREDR